MLFYFLICYFLHSETAEYTNVNVMFLLGLPWLLTPYMQRACVAFNKVLFDVQVESAFDTFDTIDKQGGTVV